MLFIKVNTYDGSHGPSRDLRIQSEAHGLSRD